MSELSSQELLVILLIPTKETGYQLVAEDQQLRLDFEQAESSDVWICTVKHPSPMFTFSISSNGRAISDSHVLIPAPKDGRWTVPRKNPSFVIEAEHKIKTRHRKREYVNMRIITLIRWLKNKQRPDRTRILHYFSTVLHKSNGLRDTIDRRDLEIMMGVEDGVQPSNQANMASAMDLSGFGMEKKKKRGLEEMSVGLTEPTSKKRRSLVSAAPAASASTSSAMAVVVPVEQQVSLQLGVGYADGWSHFGFGSMNPSSAAPAAIKDVVSAGLSDGFPVSFQSTSAATVGVSTSRPVPAQVAHTAPDRVNEILMTMSRLSESDTLNTLIQALRDEWQKQTNQKQMENDKLSRENERLHKELSDAMTARSDALKQNQELLESLARLKAENEQLKSYIGGWRRLNNEQGAKIAELTAEISQLRSNLETNTAMFAKEIGKLTEQLRNAERERAAPAGFDYWNAAMNEEWGHCNGELDADLSLGDGYMDRLPFAYSEPGPSSLVESGVGNSTLDPSAAVTLADMDAGNEEPSSLFDFGLPQDSSMTPTAAIGNDFTDF